MNDRNETAADIRKKVSQDYARDVTRPGPKNCCQPDPKGVAAKVAGYSQKELSEIPVDAAVNSFGCGNPLALADVKEGMTVLDLGSGAGIDLILAANKVGPNGRVIGIDMTDEMIAKARQNIASAGLKNVEVRKGIIEELPVENSSVDLVISNCVINLSPEKKKVFKEIARVLRPGGTISVSDIVAENLPSAILKDRALYSSCVSGAISEKEYIQGLEEAGLTNVEIRDRLVYDCGQLKGLIGSELEHDSQSSCCGGKSVQGVASGWAEKLTGKVWSARVAARKP